MELLTSLYDHLKKLPESVQAEVFDFISYLERKNKERDDSTEELLWSEMSMENALSKVEEERTLYSEKDIKEKYQ
jgi:hypothetical protein